MVARRRSLGGEVLGTVAKQQSLGAVLRVMEGEVGSEEGGEGREKGAAARTYASVARLDLVLIGLQPHHATRFPLRCLQLSRPATLTTTLLGAGSDQIMQHDSLCVANKSLAPPPFPPHCLERAQFWQSCTKSLNTTPLALPTSRSTRHPFHHTPRSGSSSGRASPSPLALRWLGTTPGTKRSSLGSTT